MVHRVNRIDPLSAGKIAALLYGIMGLIFVPFFMLASLVGQDDALPVWVWLLLPPFYIVAGFVGTALGALLYNVIAQWVGGIEVTLDHGPGTSEQPT